MSCMVSCMYVTKQCQLLLYTRGNAIIKVTYLFVNECAEIYFCTSFVERRSFSADFDQ